MKLEKHNYNLFKDLAIIMGTSVLELGAVKTSFVNKMVAELDLWHERLTTDDIKNIYQQISENTDLYAIFSETVSGGYRLEEELSESVAEEVNTSTVDPTKETTTVDVFKTVTPYIAEKQVTQATVSQLRKLRKAMTAQKYLSDEIRKHVVDMLKDYTPPKITNVEVKTINPNRMLS